MPRRFVPAPTPGHRKLKNVRNNQLSRACALEHLETRQLLSVAVPAAPQHVTVTNTGRTHSVVVSWDLVSSATVYSVRMINGANWDVVGEVSSPTHSFMVSGLDESSTRTFAVIAKNGKGASPRSASVNGTTAAFKMFDDSNYRYNIDLNNSPLQAAGMVELHRSGTAQFQQFLVNGSGAVDLTVATRIAREAAGMVQGIHFGQPRDIVIDFEIPFDSAGAPKEADTNITKMIQIIDAIKGVWSASAVPAIKALRIGAFNIPLGSDVVNSNYLLTHNVSVGGKSRKLVDNVDFFTSVNYTVTTDPASYAASIPDWTAYANSFGDAYNKPVYTYVWNSYFEQTEMVDSLYTAIDPTYWKMILNVSRQASDGVILWTNADNFDATAPWFKATQEFLAQPKSTAPAAPFDLKIGDSGIISWKNAGNYDAVYVARRDAGTSNSFKIVGSAVNGATSYSNVSSTPGRTYDYQVWAVNGFGASAKTTIGAIRQAAVDAFSVIPAGNTITRNASGGYWSDRYGQNLYGMYAGGWAHYKLNFTDVATQFNFKAGSIYDSTQLAPFKIWIDPVMVNGQPTAGPNTRMTSFSLRKTGDVFTNIPILEQSVNLSSPIAAGRHDVYIASPTVGYSNGIFSQFQFGSETSLGPAQPRELQTSSQGTSIRMRWNDWSNNETGYVVQASTDGVTFKDYAFVPTSYVASTDRWGNSMYVYNWTPPTNADYIVQVRPAHGGISAAYASAGARSNRETVSTKKRQGAIEAESYNDPAEYWRNTHSDKAGPNGKTAGTQNVLQKTGDGGVIRYRGVDFGSGANNFTFSLGTWQTYVGNQIEIWIDGDMLDTKEKAFDDGGVKVGALTTDYSGGWESFVTRTASIKLPNGQPVSGTHDVYLKFTNPKHDRGGFSIAWIDSIAVGATLGTTTGGGTSGGSTGTGTTGTGAGKVGSAGGISTGKVTHSVFSTQALPGSRVIDLIDA